MKRFVVGVLVLLFVAAPVLADYQSCRDAKCGPGSRGYTSCKWCNTDINACCRDGYDAHALTLTEYISCTTANSLAYVQCTSGQGTDGVSGGLFLTRDGERLRADRDAAALVAIEVAKLIADLNAQLGAEIK